MNIAPLLLIAGLCATSLLCLTCLAVVAVCIAKARYYWVKTQFVQKVNDE